MDIKSSMQKLIRITLVFAAFVLALVVTVPADWLAWAKTDVRPQPAAQASATPAFVGAKTCAACHAEIADKIEHAVMTKAMEKSDSCQILRDFPDQKFQSGKFNFRIVRQAEQSIYTISDGKNEISAPILYCFGQGKAGQTYVYEFNGAMCESRVSFYKEIKGLDITLGYAGDAPQNVTEAAGRQMSLDETKRCFGCHTTGQASGIATSLQINQAHLAPGVGCESCHGPGGQHVALMKAGDRAGAKAKIKKLGHLDGDDIAQNMCGSCHRSVEDVMALPNRGGINNVRFQPYRMFNSRCYSADKRIGCTACHDPHGGLEQSAAFYDSKCLACHQARQDQKPQATAAKESGAGSNGRICKVGKANCTDCHMPKIELPGSHFKFTDHRIRIVREGAPFPN